MDTMKRLYWAIPFAYREAGEREPFDRIDAQNREILAGLNDPSYLRSSKMDPTMNSAETFLHQADEIIAMYHQGEFPRELARSSVESTKALLARLELEYSPAIVKPLTQAFNSHFQLWYNEILKIVPESRFVKELFDSERKLFDKIEAFNVAMTAADTQKRASLSPSAKASRAYKTRAAISFKRASLLSGLSERTIKNLEKDPKNSAYPGRNIPEHAFLAWALGYQTEKVKKHWANMTNHPIPISSLPNFLQAKLGFKNSATFGQS